MERMAWSDERLDELARHIGTRFDAVDRRFDRRFDRVEDRLHDLSSLYLRIGGGVIAGLIGVIAAVTSTG
jgi:hypothetical protein